MTPINDKKTDLNKKLLMAIQNCDLKQTTSLIKAGANINASDNEGNTALILAVEEYFYPIIKYLIKNGADPNIRNLKNNTALLFAAEQGQLATVKLLLKKGVHPNENKKEGETPLSIAAYENQYQVVKQLLKNQTYNNETAFSWDDALSLSAQFSYNKVVDLLLKQGANPNLTTPPMDEPPLLLAAEGALAELIYNITEKNFVKVINLLIEYGADMNATDTDGQSALRIAMKERKVKILKALIKHHKQFEKIHDTIFISLIKAVINNTNQQLKRILDQTPQPKSTWITEALQLATAYGHLKIARTLLTYGANLQTIDKDKGNLIFIASEHNQKKMLKFLIRKGLSVNDLNDRGNIIDYTALLLAIESGHPKIVTTLIDHGADIHCMHLLYYISQNERAHYNALMWAIQCKDIRMIKILLKKGADPNQKNRKGETALTIAQHARNRKKIVQLLIKQKNLHADLINQALLYWIESRHFSTSDFGALKIIIKHTTDFTITNEDGYTAEQLAIEYGYESIASCIQKRLKKLGDRNINPNQ